MNKQQFSDYVTKKVAEQGSAAAINLVPLLNDMLSILLPSVIHLGDKIDTTQTNVYDVLETQEEIDAIVDDVINNPENKQVVLFSEGVTIRFAYQECSVDEVTLIAVTHDGTYTLHLSKTESASLLTFDPKA